MILDYRGNIYLPPNRIDRREIILEPRKTDKPETGGKERQVAGQVIDAVSRRGIDGARVELKIPGQAVRVKNTDENGKFTFQVRKGAAFTITARALSYLPETKNYKESPELKDILIPLTKKKSDPPCKTLEPGCLDHLMIYFDSDQAVIKPSQVSKLALIVRIMKKHPQVGIVVLGNADKTFGGKAAEAYQYNLKLSQTRARSVQQALINYGIGADRLKTAGYSYSRPLCNDDTPECLQKKPPS